MSRLAVRESFDVPIDEVSGLCTVSLERVEHVVVVGDRDTTIGWAPWEQGRPGEWRTLTVSDLADCPEDAGQFEAVATSGEGRIVILAEEPALLIEVDLAKQVCVGWWHLDVTADRRLAKKWDADENSRGEGLLLGPAGHVLVVKEKDPVITVLFGPSAPTSDDATLGTDLRWGADAWTGPGDHSLVAQSWSPLAGAPADISDVAVWNDSLWVLSDQERLVGQLEEGTHGWLVAATFPLDKTVTKPEGLTVTADGSVLVAMDTRDRSGALVSVDPPC